MSYMPFCLYIVIGGWVVQIQIRKTLFIPEGQFSFFSPPTTYTYSRHIICVSEKTQYGTWEKAILNVSSRPTETHRASQRVLKCARIKIYICKKKKE